jgi:hypothetical protein
LGRLAEAGGDGIHFDVALVGFEVLLVADEAVEIVFGPDRSGAGERFVDAAAGEALPRADDGAELTIRLRG